ncbi:mitochondrial coenzyme A diphosphatase NUDT8 [Schistocerca americana]|uniref:mitochondrial coenzyme A diphosphatase NUDT8 n=1 Tax=Schistocerca americana TaxID=7009 RepID=UPI001F4F8332|nr:mitochondrial coenzyme A diphosphatase NUDT8 [Schistocerca americana]
MTVCLRSISGRQVVLFITNARCHATSTHNLSEVIAKAIFNEENRKKGLERLQRMGPLRTKQHVPAKQAAVLVPFCIVNEEISLLYTLRSSTLKNYSGQVSFPGGMQDETDSDLEETACRETCEEIGLQKSDIEIWGHGSFVGTKDNEVVVCPYLGYIGHVNVKDLAINRTEVESVFTVPLRLFCDSSNCDYMEYPGGYTLPVFSGGEHKIWGMTAIITHTVLKSLIPDLYKNEVKLFR